MSAPRVCRAVLPRSQLEGINRASGCRRRGGEAARCPPPHRLTGSATTRRVPCSPYQAPRGSAAAPRSGHGRHLTPGRGSPHAPHTSHRPANRRAATPTTANQAAGGHPGHGPGRPAAAGAGSEEGRRRGAAVWSCLPPGECRRPLGAVTRPREVTGGRHLSRAPHGSCRSKAAGGGGGNAAFPWPKWREGQRERPGISRYTCSKV